MPNPEGRVDPASDEEFLAQLYRGGELLAAGNVTEAKDHLERAYTLHPRNEKAQNLLGLTYFKLGIYDRAANLYEKLVNDNPADPTLRVNLGLVYLKANDLPRCIREFETATDLSPEHKKAHNYLGLALAQAGEYARAKEHFVLAGSDAMADKMAKAVAAGAAPPQAVQVSADVPPAPPQPPPPPEEAQIEVMSAEERPPVEEAVPPQQPPPLPHRGRAEPVEEARPPQQPPPLPHRVSAEPVDQAAAPEAIDARVATQVQSEGEAASPPARVEDDMVFAEDEGPHALPMPEEPVPGDAVQVVDEMPVVDATAEVPVEVFSQAELPSSRSYREAPPQGGRVHDEYSDPDQEDVPRSEKTQRFPMWLLNPEPPADAPPAPGTPSPDAVQAVADAEAPVPRPEAVGWSTPAPAEAQTLDAQVETGAVAGWADRAQPGEGQMVAEAVAGWAEQAQPGEGQVAAETVAGWADTAQPEAVEGQVAAETVAGWADTAQPEAVEGQSAAETVAGWADTAQAQVVEAQVTTEAMAGWGDTAQAEVIEAPIGSDAGPGWADPDQVQSIDSQISAQPADAWDGAAQAEVAGADAGAAGWAGEATAADGAQPADTQAGWGEPAPLVEGGTTDGADAAQAQAGWAEQAPIVEGTPGNGAHAAMVQGEATQQMESMLESQSPMSDADPNAMGGTALPPEAAPAMEMSQQPAQPLPSADAWATPVVDAATPMNTPAVSPEQRPWARAAVAPAPAEPFDNVTQAENWNVHTVHTVATAEAVQVPPAPHTDFEVPVPPTMGTSPGLPAVQARYVDESLARSAQAVDPAYAPVGAPRLADIGPSLDWSQNAMSGPFLVSRDGLALQVKGELLSRLGGLVAVVGEVDAKPEMRKMRGRASDQSFGEGPAQMQRVTGTGVLYLEPGRATFHAINLDDDAFYAREELVFAFEESIAFENGRLSADGGLGLDMLHLKGQGQVLMRLEGALKTMAIPLGSPLVVPLARLVGWYGTVSPRLKGFVGQGAVELVGEGYALLVAPG